MIMGSTFQVTVLIKFAEKRLSRFGKAALATGAALRRVRVSRAFHPA
jgi:hypothetical protein